MRVMPGARGLVGKGPGLFDRLEKLRIEEQGGDDDDLPEVKIAPKAAAPVAAAQPVAVAAKKPAAASSRLAALESQSGGGARSNMESSKPKGMLAKGGGGNTTMKVWETLTKVYLGCYMAYTLAFPLRLIIAPNFFQLLEGVLSMFGSHAAAESAGSMF